MLAAITLIIGLGLLAYSAKKAIQYTEEIAAALGLSEHGVASTVIATMTSLPELIVVSLAAMQGDYKIITGTVFGSIIGLLLLSLGLLGLIGNMRFGAEEKRSAHRSLAIVVLVAILTILLSGMTWWVGIGLIAAYVWFARTQTDGGEQKKGRNAKKGHAWKAVGKLAIAVAVLIASAELTIHSIEELATEFGISPFVIAFIVVAIGTNLPELSVEITSTLQGKEDIALGDILGSSVADATLVFGTAAIIAKYVPFGMGAHIGAGMLLTASLIALKTESGNKLTMWESVGLLIAYFLIISIEMALGQ
jgi:cation:H+ antiporter